MDSVQIARVAHEVNRAYCQSLGDDSQPPWDEAPDWQTQSAINGVEFHRNNPDAGPEASHIKWLEEKEADEWVYGEVKDPVKKTHPCFQLFECLPKEQQAKDYIFRAVVLALKDVWQDTAVQYENELIDLSVAIHEYVEQGRMGYAIKKLMERDEKWQKACAEESKG